MIKIIEDDILNSKSDIIAHQVNCKNVMNSGVAKTLRNTYPQIYNSYSKYCSIYKSKLLGSIQLVKISEQLIICNMFAQDGYGRDKQYTNIDAFKLCLTKLKKYAEDNNKTISLPYMIGCDRGGANWNEVYSIIEDLFKESTIELTLYKLKK